MVQVNTLGGSASRLLKRIANPCRVLLAIAAAQAAFRPAGGAFPQESTKVRKM
jgi:hypothetical protein